MTPTPQERLAHAEAQIDWYTREINHHDRSASGFRKAREKHKAARDRALKAIEREKNALTYQQRKEK